MSARGTSTALPYRHVGKSGLRVSELCLGTMTFGQHERPGQCAEAASHAILDKFVEYGGNFFDTADVYCNGDSERILGTWLKKNNREDLVVATKVRFSDATSGANSASLSRKHVLASIVQSLERLQTDYVDIYQCHSWDNGTPLEETLRTMSDLVKAGKIRYFGVSNYSGWQLQKLVDLSKHMGLEPVISLQQQYSLLTRETELELVDVCRNEGVSLLPWSPLKGGWLTGKFHKGMVEAPQGTRVRFASDKNLTFESHPTFASYATDKTWKLLDLMKQIAKEHGRTVPQVALRWLLQKDTVSSVIIGVKTMEQLVDDLGACGWQLTADNMLALDEASQYHVPYPYEAIWRANANKAGSLGPKIK